MSADALHVVLFGLPSAGKTALLTAVARSAHIQQPALDGQQIAGNSKPTREAVVESPLMLEWPSEGENSASTWLDTSGSAAADLIADKRPLYGWRSGPLARAVRTADALVIAVDASADNDKLQHDFAELAAFLRRFEQTRSRRTEVSGLPVYLVLTKCDLLARPGDTMATWQQRIDDRKRQVELALRKYLAYEADRALAFGKLNLRVLATATRLPLVNQPADGQDTFGVADLFRDCMQRAAEFEESRGQCADRLKLTLLATAALIGIMCAVAVGVYASRPSADIAGLENALQGYLPAPDAPPAERFREPLDKKLERLHLIQQDPAFNRLPAGTRTAVTSYARELEAYRKFNKEFLDKVRDPRLATSAQDLKNIEEQLKKTAVPEEYAASWQETRIGRRAEQWHKDIKALRTEVANVHAWIEQQIGKGRELEEAGLELRVASADKKKAWLDRYRHYLEQRWPYPARKRVPGTGISYETVYRFDTLQRAQQVWDEFKQKNLGYVRQLLERAT